MGWFRKKRYEGYTVDLGRFKKKELSTVSDGSATTPVSTETASFFGDMAGIGTANESSSSNDSQINGFSSSSASSSNLELHDKIDMLSNRILKLLDRIELLELKLSRLERSNAY